MRGYAHLQSKSNISGPLHPFEVARRITLKFRHLP
jgi:hypothetical protein